MVREWGWEPRGERVLGTVPQGHGETTTLVLAVRQAGLIAPMVTAGAMNEPLFLADVRELRCPTLAPGDLVIWDNLSVHAVAGVRDAIETRLRSRLSALRPYWFKFKAALRSRSITLPQSQIMVRCDKGMSWS